jgi:predicted flap endonuclease-1-like 5' DNA nuclease
MDPLAIGVMLAFFAGILMAGLYMFRQLKVDARKRSEQEAAAAARPRSMAPSSARPSGWVDVAAYNGAAAGQVEAVMLEIKTATPEDPARGARSKSLRPANGALDGARVAGANYYPQQRTSNRKSTSAAMTRERQPLHADAERDTEMDAEPESLAEPGATSQMSQHSRRQQPRQSQRQSARETPHELSELQLLARALEQRGCGPHVADLLAANGITSVESLTHLDDASLALVIDDPQERAKVEEVARTATLLRGSAQV